MRAVKTSIWSAAIKWKVKCSQQPPQWGWDTDSCWVSLTAVLSSSQRGSSVSPGLRETKSLIPDLGWSGKRRRERVNAALKGRGSDTKYTQTDYKCIQIPTKLLFPSSSDPRRALLLSPNSRDCRFPPTILPWARINIHLLLSTFYAHYFFTWFSMWKFKIPPGLIIHRWKPKYTRKKYPSPSQREVNGFASSKKGRLLSIRQIIPSLIKW